MSYELSGEWWPHCWYEVKCHCSMICGNWQYSLRKSDAGFFRQLFLWGLEQGTWGDRPDNKSMIKCRPTTHIRCEWDTIFDASPSVKLRSSMIKWMNIWSLLVNSAHFVFCGRSIFNSSWLIVHDSVLPHKKIRNKGDGLGTIILLLLWRPHCYAPTKVHF